MSVYDGKHVVVDEDRAHEVFALLAHAWRERSGIFREAVFPEDRIEYPEDPREKANWLFWMAHFMRGGIVSDDAINMFGIMAEIRPEMFDPFYLADAKPEEFVELVRSANQTRLIRMGKRIHANGNGLVQIDFDFASSYLREEEDRYRESFGRSYRRKTLPRNAGTIGYKLQEHGPNVINNAKVLCERFAGDARNFFKLPGGEHVKHFEEFFAQINHETNGSDGVLGMRRKIAALLHLWLEKFALIPRGIPFPLIVDFHLLRVLFSTGIISFKRLKPLEQTGRKNPYPEALLGKDYVHVSDAMREEIMAWSVDFLSRPGSPFTSFELSLAMWILSRELCSSHAQTKALDNKTRYISYKEIVADPNLRLEFPSLCGFCPVKDKCTGTFSSGPHYEWGIIMPQKRFHYETRHLPGLDMSEHLLPVRSHADRGARY